MSYGESTPFGHPPKTLYAGYIYVNGVDVYTLVDQQRWDQAQWVDVTSISGKSFSSFGVKWGNNQAGNLAQTYFYGAKVDGKLLVSPQYSNSRNVVSVDGRSITGNSTNGFPFERGSYLKLMNARELRAFNRQNELARLSSQHAEEQLAQLTIQAQTSTTPVQ